MRKSFAIKIISLTVSALFFISSIAADISYAAISSFHANTAHDGASKSPKAGAAVIPGRLGLIDDEYTGSSGMKVFHIKDAHCNYDAQRSIYGLIDWIAEKYGVELINLEGGGGRYDLSPLENIESPVLKESITDEYLRAGKITGAELYRVHKPEKVRLAGIEDAYLYEENLGIYKGLLEYRSQIDSFLDKADSIVQERAEKVLNGDLRAFLSRKELFDRNHLGLDKYLPYLFRTANSLSYDFDDYPNSLLMTKLLLKEREIDFEKAKTERGRLVQDVLGRLSRYERGQVLSRIVMFETGEMTESEMHGFLLAKAGEVGLDPDNYPQLARYRDYLLLYDQMDKARLFEEIKRIEERLSASLCHAEEEKEILENGVQAALLRDMFELRLGRDGLGRAKKEIDVTEILSFMKKYAAGDEYRYLEEKAVYVSYGMSRMMEFYAVADQRDDAFVRNIIGNMEENGVNVSIIVTGGFHSDSLHRILREKGVSFVSINPSFVNPPGYRSPYMRLLSGEEDTSFSELYSLFSSTIQLKSLWSKFGIDTDFAASFIVRLNTAIEVAKRQEKDGIVIKLGDKSVMLLRAMGYEPAPNVPDGYETRPEYSVIDAAGMMGLSPGECIEKLFGLIGPNADYGPANEFAGNMHMAEMLRSLLSRYMDRGAEEELANGTVRKNAYLRTYEGRIVQQKLKGMGDVDTFDYILDIQQGVLTCQFSCARTISGYMSEPSVIRGSNEKSYLCQQLRRIFRPGITPEEQKKILQELIDEQAEYESRGACGWQWVIDRDENGEILVNEATGYGLRSFRIFDRSKLPEGIAPQNLDADAEKYGSREMVQEMVFDITPMRGDKIRIKLINSWGAQEAAYTDPLTGLFNRRYFNLKIKPRIPRHDKATILFIDIDHFKRFNDTYSGEHQFGDMILKAVSGVILRTVRGSDTVFRWGGEEFVVVLPEASGTQGKIVGRNILTNVKKLRPKDLRPADEISVTVGVTEIADTKDIDKVGEAIEKADKVMLDAKRRSMRGVVISFDEELPAYLKGAAAVAVATTAVSKDIIVRDLNDILGIYHPAMLENLREFLIGEKIGGTSQGEGLTRIFMDLQRDAINGKIEQLRAYQDVLQKEDRRPEDLETAASIARKHLRALYLTLSRIRERIYAVVGDSPATQRVRNAILNMEKAMDLMYKYLTDEDRTERELSPFGTPDGDSLMWLDRNGTIIWHPALQGEARELRAWNARHENWHRKLNEKYPDASKAAKEIAATYMAYREFEYVTDEHLENLLYAIFPEYDFTPHERRHEKFIPGAAEYLRHTAVTIDLAEIEKEALRMTEEVLFKEAGEKCIVFMKKNPEHAPAVEVMAYIAIKRPDLVRGSLVGLFSTVLRTEGAPDKTCAIVCEALRSVAEEHPELITRGTVDSIGILSRRGEYGPGVHEAAVGALAAIAQKNLRLMNEIFAGLHPLYQIGVIERVLDLDRLLPEEMHDGDRKGIKTLCSYRVRQYLMDEKVPDWFLNRVSAPDRSAADLPLDDSGKPAITLEKFLSEKAARETLRGILSARFIDHMVEQIGSYGELGIPALRGELTNVSLRMPEEFDDPGRYSVERNANLAVLLGFEIRDEMSDRETHAYYSVPDITHHMTETILIHVLKECGLISPVGMSYFSQFVSGRMPDDAKYIQIANVILFPVKYDWNSWLTTDPVSGIPPIAYGRGEHGDKTVFDVDYVDMSEVSPTEKNVVTYDEAMDFFAHMQTFKQFLSWALQSSLIAPAERTKTQGYLAIIWSDFRSQMERILRDVELYNSLAAPVWISPEPMDGVGLNEYQWTYGSQQRRETIKEGLIELEKARREKKELVERTYALVADLVKRIRNLVEEESARKKEFKNIAREWSRAVSGMMTQEGDKRQAEADFYKTSSPVELVRSVFERTEKLFGDEVSGDFGETKLSGDAFSAAVKTLQETHGVTKAPADKARYREKEEVRSADQWLSRMAVRINRFPGEKRVVIYPVYSAMAYAKETTMSSKLRRRLAEGDYGFNVVPIPYLAEDPVSRERAINNMHEIVGKDENARAMIYGDAGFFEENNESLKAAYGGRVICVKEDGGAPYDDPAHISFYLRAALALTVIDYFDPRNDFKDEHREKLEDMIAAILALINGDKDVIEAFKESPARLINGIIVLKPAERMSWEDVDEKMRASEQFLHSL